MELIFWMLLWLIITWFASISLRKLSSKIWSSWVFYSGFGLRADEFIDWIEPWSGWPGLEIWPPPVSTVMILFLCRFMKVSDSKTLLVCSDGWSSRMTDCLLSSKRLWGLLASFWVWCSSWFWMFIISVSSCSTFFWFKRFMYSRSSSPIDSRPAPLDWTRETASKFLGLNSEDFLDN